MRHARQPRMAIVTLSTALILLAGAFGWDARSLASISLGSLTLVLTLGAICMLAYQFPIYIRHNAKVCITSIPLYLMVVLLPPPLAASSVALAVLGGEVLARVSRGTYVSDIVTATARWILVALGGSLVAHLSLAMHNPLIGMTPLLLAAAVLWLGDILTLPLVLAPISAEAPGRIIRTVMREGAVVEGVQYLLGVVGAWIAMHQVWALAMLAVPALLVHLACKKDLDEDTTALLESMADMVDLRDPYTGGHSRRVSGLTAGVLEMLGTHGQEARLITTAARIHDLGKIGLPDTLLIKSGALSAEEEALIQSYPEQGAAILSRYPDFSRGIEMVRHHHERWDGLGYPDGLEGTEIPFASRLIAVADSFDAMVSDRPYRRALSAERAAQILWDGKGRQWDPLLVDVFLRSIGHTLTAQTPQIAPGAVPATALAGQTLMA